MWDMVTNTVARFLAASGVVQGIAFFRGEWTETTKWFGENPALTFIGIAIYLLLCIWLRDIQRPKKEAEYKAHLEGESGNQGS